jgi:hypothetical protein
MKKYLLLASVAGCLMASNVMAGTPSGDGQSATIGVGVTFWGPSSITGATDLNFGTLVSKTASFELSSNTKLATIANSVVTLNDTTHFLAKTGTPASAVITMDNSSFTSSNLDVSCVGEEYDGGCVIDSHSGITLTVKDISLTDITGGQVRMDASLYLTGTVGSQLIDSSFSTECVRVTLKY